MSFSPGAKVWKIATGKDAQLWPAWEREIGEDGDGFVAMGWNVVGSLDGQTYDDIRKKVAEKAEEEWNTPDQRTNEKYVTEQLWDFRNKPATGDLFIVYLQSAHVLPVLMSTFSGTLKTSGAVSIARLSNDPPRLCDQGRDGLGDRLVNQRLDLFGGEARPHALQVTHLIKSQYHHSGVWREWPPLLRPSRFFRRTGLALAAVSVVSFLE